MRGSSQSAPASDDGAVRTVAGTRLSRGRVGAVAICTKYSQLRMPCEPDLISSPGTVFDVLLVVFVYGSLWQSEEAQTLTTSVSGRTRPDQIGDSSSRPTSASTGNQAGRCDGRLDQAQAEPHVPPKASLTRCNRLSKMLHPGEVRGRREREEEIQRRLSVSLKSGERETGREARAEPKKDVEVELPESSFCDLSVDGRAGARGSHCKYPVTDYERYLFKFVDHA